MYNILAPDRMQLHAAQQTCMNLHKIFDGRSLRKILLQVSGARFLNVCHGFTVYDEILIIKCYQNSRHQKT